MDENMNSAAKMNDSTGTIRILLNDDTSYEAQCSEEEYLTAMKILGQAECEPITYEFYLRSLRTTNSPAPYGMIALEFNNKQNIISVYPSDIKRIYWEANI